MLRTTAAANFGACWRRSRLRPPHGCSRDLALPAAVTFDGAKLECTLNGRVLFEDADLPPPPNPSYQ